MRQLFHEYFFGFFFLDKFAHFLGKVLRLELVAHFGAQFKALTEMDLVHEVKDLLLVLGNHADANGVEALFVHALLQLGDFVLVEDGLTLRVLIVVLRAEVLECLPVLLAEALVVQVQLHREQLALNQGQVCLVLALRSVVLVL